MNKKILLLVPFLAAIIALNAQTRIGIDYYKAGDYDLAKMYLDKEPAPKSAESCYFLGEIAFVQGKIEEAVSFYNQGLNVDKNYPLNQVGLVKVLLKNNKEALSSIIEIQKKYGKSVEISVAIGYAYLDNGLIEEALLQVEAAKKINKKNPDLYVLEGDILRTSQKYGEAAGKYDMAIYFDPNCAVAYVKGAKIYEFTNRVTAIDKLKNILSLQPDYIIATRYLAKLYTSYGYHSLAVETFKTFFASGYYTIEDITRYVTALYFNGQYDEAAKTIKEGLALEPDNFVLNRLQMYNAAKISDSENGILFAKKFFSLKEKNENAFLSKDHEIYAGMLKDAKMYDQALIEYQNAINLDTNSVELLKEMATILSSQGKNGYAADLFHQYIEKKGADKIEANDYFQLGRYYYNAANIRNAADTNEIAGLQNNESFIKKISGNGQKIDSLKNNIPYFVGEVVNYYLSHANSSFDTVINRIPDVYLGYLWKARTNSLLDPESEIGLAKPHYEKTIETLLAKEEANTTRASISALIEAYSYLGYFYYLKEDKPNTLLYWNKVLELDPNNANAIAVINSIK